MNSAQLRKIAPAASPAAIGLWLPELNAACDRFGIVGPEDEACFFSQILVESGNLSRFTENLAYRPQAIMAKFRGRFKLEEAVEYGYVPGKQSANQRMIANIAYGGRYGNRGRDTDDGWNYRGRGPIQLTFKGNYEACAKAIGIDLVEQPQMLAEPRAGSLAAAWFWAKGNKTGKSLSLLARAGEINQISLIVNPGGEHLVERFNIASRGLKVLESLA